MNKFFRGLAVAVGLFSLVQPAFAMVVLGTTNGLAVPAGTSGGVPYYSSASSIASSAALAANFIVVGGGAGAAPVTSGCTIVNNSPGCSSAVAFTPQMILTNTTTDANSSLFQFQKIRTSSAVTASDGLGEFVFQGFSNAAFNTASVLQSVVDGAPSGSNVPGKLQAVNTDSTGAIQVMTFDSKAHLGFSPSAVPAITGCGGSPSVATGGDVAGQVTEGTTATGCTITFAKAYTAAPFCVVGLQTQQAAFAYTLSTTAIVVTNTSTSGDKINWVCHGI